MHELNTNRKLSNKAVCAVLWLLLLTGEMMKWAHLGTYQVNSIAVAQFALTTGVGSIVLVVVAYGIALKAHKVCTGAKMA